jgi:hypothetical protein
MTVVFISCDLLLENNDDVPSGAYSYTASDSLGTVVVEGWFTMVNQGSKEFNGEWHFKKIGDPQNIGPQVGDGELLGFEDSTGVQINLNPQNADNNVILLGEFTGDQYTGEWQWVTFIGPTNKGDFKAIQN